MELLKIDIYHHENHIFTQKNWPCPYKNHQETLWTIGSIFNMVLHEWFHNFHMLILIRVSFNWLWKSQKFLIDGSSAPADLDLVLFIFSKFWTNCRIRMSDHIYTHITDITRYCFQLSNDTPTFAPSLTVMILQPSEL